MIHYNYVSKVELGERSCVKSWIIIVDIMMLFPRMNDSLGGQMITRVVSCDQVVDQENFRVHRYNVMLGHSLIRKFIMQCVHLLCN